MTPSSMSPRLSVRSGSRIDEYSRQHAVDLASDGRLHVLDAARLTTRTYERAHWTLLIEPGVGNHDVT
ncbi:hypothetical protein R1CP_37650 (plasmid) [Rhodococcus opacus]|uniref:Uncharacterized protein n=1 Tax=Rhodococcus opacus TaxID=37919 RepID=A0A1B1KHN8_RHOOP|nr:hypothetical protein R1CP_37650 [Rhodococcus opacus]